MISYTIDIGTDARTGKAQSGPETASFSFQLARWYGFYYIS